MNGGEFKDSKINAKGMYEGKKFNSMHFNFDLFFFFILTFNVEVQVGV